MRVQRLDLGADVIYVPTRDLLVIHPDLDYAQSIGAVAGTIPGLHPDVVVSLVEQVTPRPKPERRFRHAVVVAARLGVAAVLTAAIMLVQFGPTSQATATATFGEAFTEEMSRLGLVCSASEERYRTCVSEDGEVSEVRGFRRGNANLYMIDHPDGKPPQFLLVFDTRRDAEHYQWLHPEHTVTGRIAVW